MTTHKLYSLNILDQHNKLHTMNVVEEGPACAVALCVDVFPDSSFPVVGEVMQLGDYWPRAIVVDIATRGFVAHLNPVFRERRGQRLAGAGQLGALCILLDPERKK